MNNETKSGNPANIKRLSKQAFDLAEQILEEQGMKPQARGYGQEDYNTRKAFLASSLIIAIQLQQLQERNKNAKLESALGLRPGSKENRRKAA